MSVTPGISFLIRARNEQDILGECLDSLRQVWVPHEIILVLHRCTDASADIAHAAAAANPHLRVFSTDIQVSRPGFENLVTDVESPHGLTAFQNERLANQARHAWRFTWGADFVMTPEIAQWLNARYWGAPPLASTVVFSAVDDDGVTNVERYLHSHHFRFVKSWFWEDHYASGEIHQQLSGLRIPHRSSLHRPKAYWSDTPWFFDDDSDEAALLRTRYTALVDLVGPEPAGFAQASNPAAWPVIHACFSRRAEIEALGIEPLREVL